MTDQLSAKDWLDQGLKTLAESGFTALKAEPLAKAMGVSRGSFYWHFADIGAFHAAILKHWREVAAEQIIANVEAASERRRPAARCCCAGYSASKLALEKAVRTWATRRSRGARRGAGHRPAPAELCRKPAERSPDYRRQWPAPARKFSIGRFSALRCRTSRCRKRDNRPCSTNCCGWPRVHARHACDPDMLQDHGRAGDNK